MDVFDLRHQLIADYTSYSKSFINIRDARIRAKVDEELASGALWPNPLVQLNPGFEAGPWISQMVAEGLLHPLTERIFRLDKAADGSGQPMRLYRHQAEAAAVGAQTEDSYILTTGTGSGKSLAYIVPIVNHILRRGSGNGVQVVIVYPMNALANSQMNELDKFLKQGFDRPPVTYRRYTGQESDPERDEIIQNPPDILLTNYVMLELMLTRPRERRLIDAMQGLRFLVLDELHTYRGRQGADVAMLIRRVREVAQNPNLRCVGTSATLTGGGSFAEQQVEIAAVASELFGTAVAPARVIGETLRRLTIPQDATDAAFKTRLTERVRNAAQEPPQAYDAFIADPLAIWIENTFGLQEEAGSGRLKRAEPISIAGDEGAARRLHNLTGVALDACDAAIRQTLLAGYQIKQPEVNAPVFAFRLHQFLSRGDTVFASLDAPAERYITLNAGAYVPGDRQRLLFPVCFCRECGQEYYSVTRLTGRPAAEAGFAPRALRESAADEDAEAGYLYYNGNGDNRWPADLQTAIADNRVPEDWLESSKTSPSGWRVQSGHRPKLPVPVSVTPLGVNSADGLAFQFIRAPFAFCLNCGVAYAGRMSDVSKLATLSLEGRSTATTVLGLSVLRALRRDDTLDKEARKLLSFTDNRQDASLQAGHFNDFVEVGLVRAALYKAVQAAGASGIRHDHLAQSVFDALALVAEQFVAEPDGGRSKARLANEALRDVLGYRVYHDLRRGWRINAPNLEQCDLLRIDYLDLEEICADETVWAGRHERLAAATPAQRRHVSRVLLDVIRRGLAIKVIYLDPNYQEGLKQRSPLLLVAPWAIDETERLTHSYVAIPGPARLRGRNSGEYLPISERSGFGSFVRRAFRDSGSRLTLEQSRLIIGDLFAVLAAEGPLERVEEPRVEADVPGYQLNAALMVWRAGDGTHAYHDPIRVPRLPDETQAAAPNPFFINFYNSVALDLKGIRAREHTAQVPGDIREEREKEFRQAELPLLFCSPTMELGVDIAQLNAVNMRNVPPTPANYAQRSGRAGRSGQPALVYTYCASGSPHDQYFFKRPSDMVAGAVRPPRLDLTNEDLLRAHVHAVWLAEVGRATGFQLGNSLRDLLDIPEEPAGLPIRPELRAALDSPAARDNAQRRALRVLSSIDGQLRAAAWYSDDWLRQVISQAADRLNDACDRWRGLYLSAWATRSKQDRVAASPNSAASEKQQATRLRAEAEAQLNLLLNANEQSYSDFYSYRYFAAEGFLPGYNFPRLPLSAYIEGRRGRGRDQEGEYLSRPRFLAISEFGPRSVIYHEGSRHVINKVILPSGDSDLLTTRAKVCAACGYLHPLSDEVDPELCDNCGAPLPGPLTALLRMQNVSTRRRDRISSDEEERVRMGYRLQTSVRYAERDGRPDFAVATVANGDGRLLLTMTYGSAATIWRINMGWKRSGPDKPPGFVLDIERGYWEKNEDEPEADADDPMSARTRRVIPFVEDRRNCLILKFEEYFENQPAVMASLQPALKNAIQVLYQLEDNELAVEPLPDAKERTAILLYESAEGGAGVLRRLVSEPEAIRRVAHQALELCHFDRASGEDKRRAPRGREDCESACYDCLMSYTNQPDHALLDRHLIRDLLLAVANGAVAASPTRLERDALLAQLKAACESSLEREWLDFLIERRLNLPDAAQELIEGCQTRPDFFYSRRGVAIYVDGPDHDTDLARRNDARITDCLEGDLSLTVLRFRYDQRAEWARICADYAYIFGQASE